MSSALGKRTSCINADLNYQFHNASHLALERALMLIL